MNLIASCPAIVDDTFFKKRTAHGKCLSSELRRDDSILPVEVHIRKVDSWHTFILISTENSFIIHGNEPFKFRPELTDLSGKILKNLNSLCSTNCENDNIAKLCSVLPVKICHIAQAVDQSLPTCNDISDHQCAVRNHGKLTIFDFKPCNLFIRKYTLTG